MKINTKEKWLVNPNLSLEYHDRTKQKWLAFCLNTKKEKLAIKRVEILSEILNEGIKAIRRRDAKKRCKIS